MEEAAKRKPHGIIGRRAWRGVLVSGLRSARIFRGRGRVGKMRFLRQQDRKRGINGQIAASRNDHPIIYQIFSNGKTRLMGKRRDRKLSVLSMFGIGSVDKNGQKLTVFRLIRDLGGLGVGMALIIFFIFLGSTLAMVF